MEIIPAKQIPAVKLVLPKLYHDERGAFAETWREDLMEAAGLRRRFVQDNHAVSNVAGTIRGLHFQIGRAAQDKLVRCVRGSIFDVAVDVRRGSPSYGKCVSAILSAANWTQLYVPTGFAHGYCTLEDDSEVLYKVTAGYDPAAERGIIWDDPGLGIEWPIVSGSMSISDKDRRWPPFDNLPAYFELADCPG
jgi:dTDP-4-dehydrorhamnose 3,5-epimerase